MKTCPKCKLSDYRKDGIVKERQRCLCLNCGYHFSVHLKSSGKSEDIKRNALILYLEGLGFRSIGRYLQVSHVSVYQWIKKFGQELNAIRSSKEIEVIEIDEMHTYVKSKKTIVGYGLLWIEMGKDSSIAKWAPGAQKQEKNYGNKLKLKQRE